MAIAPTTNVVAASSVGPIGSPSSRALAVLATPVIGITTSAILLGEPIGLTELAATALVVGAIATVIPRGRS